MPASPLFARLLHHPGAAAAADLKKKRIEMPIIESRNTEGKIGEIWGLLGQAASS